MARMTVSFINPENPIIPLDLNLLDGFSGLIQYEHSHGVPVNISTDESGRGGQQ